MKPIRHVLPGHGSIETGTDTGSLMALACLLDMFRIL
jgi:hypothetical protein